MALDSINLTTVALAIFVICAGFVLVRGALRIALGSLILSFSAWLAFRVWQVTPSLCNDWFHQPLPWLTTAAPAAAFIVSFLIGRFVVKILASPFQKQNQERKPLTLMRLISAALFTLIPTGLIGSIAALFLNHAGSLEEIKNAAIPSAIAGSSLVPNALKASIGKIIPAAWLQMLDPQSDPSRVALAKLIASQAERAKKPAVIDPVTGEPIPRAIIINDPALQTLVRSGDFNSLLNHPLLTRALADPQVQQALKNLKL
jgi:hypothetical protein